MIIFLIAMILAVFFLTPVFFSYSKDKKNGDLLKPARLLGLIHFITIVPYLIYVSYDNSAISNYVLSHRSIDDLDIAIGKYAIVQSIGFFALLLGLRSRLAVTIANRLPLVGVEYNKIKLMVGFLLTLFIGIAAYLYLLQQIGGLNFLLNNLQKRASIRAGTGYISTFMICLTISVSFLIYSMKDKATSWKKMFIFLVMLLIIVIYTSLGGRSSTFKLIGISLIVYHYGVKRIQNISPRFILMVSILAIYFITIPLFRGEGSFNYYKNNVDQLVADIRGNYETLISQTSYVDHYLLAVNHFNINNIWLGASYLDLLKAPIPRTILPDKPPVDDGVYLRTIAEGIDVKPGTPYNYLSKTSWPPETLGITYMNFWIPGVMLGMYLLGMIYKIFYSYMFISKFSLFSIMIYANILFYFHFSNLRLVQSSTNIILIILIFIIIFRIKFKRINQY